MKYAEALMAEMNNPASYFYYLDRLMWRNCLLAYLCHFDSLEKVMYLREPDAPPTYRWVFTPSAPSGDSIYLVL